MPSQSIRLVLFTRYPVAGQAKTRLIPAIGPSAAAQVHKLLTERTIGLLSLGQHRVEVHYTGGTFNQFENWLGQEIRYVEQPEGDLTAKLLAAIDPAPVIFFGSDTPDLETKHIEAAVGALRDHDVTIGPAEDGGYYLIGMRQSLPSLFENISWSTEAVLEETLDRIEQHDLSVKLLETLSDCDRPDDLSRWPWLNQ